MTYTDTHAHTHMYTDLEHLAGDEGNLVDREGGAAARVLSLPRIERFALQTQHGEREQGEEQGGGEV